MNSVQSLREAESAKGPPSGAERREYKSRVTLLLRDTDSGQLDHMAAEPTHGPHQPCTSSSWLGARGTLLAIGNLLLPGGSNIKQLCTIQAALTLRLRPRAGARLALKNRPILTFNPDSAAMPSNICHNLVIMSYQCAGLTDTGLWPSRWGFPCRGFSCLRLACQWRRAFESIITWFTLSGDTAFLTMVSMY